MKSRNAKSIIVMDLVIVLLFIGYLVIPAYAAVTLVRFEIISINNNAITLEWETASEYNNLGFFIVRSGSEGGEYIPVSDFIPAEGSAVNGYSYQFVDGTVTAGQIYFYKLQAVDLNSTYEYFGPITNFPNPTPTRTSTQTKSSSSTLTTTITQTRTATIASSATISPTVTETSPFSFVTNTNTVTATVTAIVVILPGTSETPFMATTVSPTEIEVKTSTNQVKITSTFTPTIPAVQSVTPQTAVVVGFLGVIAVGILLIAGLVFYSRFRKGTRE